MAKKAHSFDLLTSNGVEILHRSVAVDKRAMDKEARTVKVRVSSTTEVPRWFGGEVLDHSRNSIRMDRATEGIAVLMEHDSRARVGITESVTLAGDSLEAVVRFARTASGDSAMAEVEDGTLKYLSVGYRVHEYERDKPPNDDGEGEVYRAVDWEPLEVSFVSIPADTRARVLRSGVETYPVKIRMSTQTANTDPTPPAAPTVTASSGGPSILETRNNEKNRVKGILAAAGKFRDRVPKAMEEAQRAIDSDKGVDAFNQWLLDALETGQSEHRSDNVQPPATQFRSPGEELIRNPQFAQAWESNTIRRGNRFSLSAEIVTRATLTTSVSGLTKYERPPGVIELGQQQLLVSQLFSQGMTENTTIRYLQEDTFTNASTALAEEGTYQEQAWDLSEQDSAVRKVGVLSRITDEMAADSAAVEAYFNARTQYAVASRQDVHLVSGSGSSNQIAGILNVSGIQTESSGGSSTPIDAVLKAITKVRSVGFFEPDAILMNPTDWQSVCLTKDSNGQYLLGGPTFGPYGQGQYANVRTLWGLPVVSTTSISQGTALVGAFKLGAQLWMRQGLQVEMTNSDASDFANGRVAIRAALRHALAVYRPAAFCTVTGIPS